MLPVSIQIQFPFHSKLCGAQRNQLSECKQTEYIQIESVVTNSGMEFENEFIDTLIRDSNSNNIVLSNLLIIICDWINFYQLLTGSLEIRFRIGTQNECKQKIIIAIQLIH